MKKILLLSLSVLSGIGFMACNNSSNENSSNTDSTVVIKDGAATGTPVEGTYTNLNTGQAVTLTRNDQGYMADASTGEPVEFYVDMNSMDTFYGRTGTLVNYAIIHTDEGKYELDETKVKWDGDEMKIKDETGKTKIDGDEYKDKTGDSKTKVDDDESKIKNDNVKVKSDGDEIKVKSK